MKKWVIGFILLLTLTVLAACSGGDASTANASKEVDTINIGYQKGNTLHILKESAILEEAAKEKGITIN